MDGLFLSAVHVLEQQAGAFEEDRETSQVGGVLPSCFIDEPKLLTHSAGTEEEDHDEGVGEAHFGSVDGAIAECFEEDERLLIFRVEQDVLLNGGLYRLLARVEVLIPGGRYLERFEAFHCCGYLTAAVDSRYL